MDVHEPTCMTSCVRKNEYRHNEKHQQYAVTSVSEQMSDFWWCFLDDTGIFKASSFHLTVTYILSGPRLSGSQEAGNPMGNPATGHPGVQHCTHYRHLYLYVSGLMVLRMMVVGQSLSKRQSIWPLHSFISLIGHQAPCSGAYICSQPQAVADSAMCDLQRYDVNAQPKSKIYLIPSAQTRSRKSTVTVR